jgi:aspartate--ammonia ligase
MQLHLPENYRPVLDTVQTERAIKQVKDYFELNLAAELKCRRVTAPLFVPQGTGINDDLNGEEQPVSFSIRDMQGQVAEVVHSLAKWKRLTLSELNIGQGYGIYTDMNAIRADETLTNMHSLYVDQWDWEVVISENQRTLHFLKETVVSIFRALKRTEFFIYENHPELTPQLPDDITFIHSEDLQQAYPGLTPREREARAARQYGAIFVIGIGAPLGDGQVHDGRAPDYDDWSTETSDRHRGLNGDIILWNSVLDCPFEISSMGIRVDKATLLKQLDASGTPGRAELYFHRQLLEGRLPQSIGGGIGQSRSCMYFLRKAHIGEVQASIWPDGMRSACRDHGIHLM